MNFNLAHGELVSFLQSSESMRKTASGSLKAGLIAGGGALAGGEWGEKWEKLNSDGMNSSCHTLASY